ncbi:MAG: MATE family efflux transporter [Anaerovoracaceae bacterium]|nr:MATE family efflux transporter [Anaerovoracaceae bacterium]
MKKNEKRKNNIDMLSGPLMKKILLFAVPLAATSILQQLFNTVDTAVAGRFAGSLALAACGSTSSLITLYVNLFVGISVGANVVIANLIGQGRDDRINAAVKTAMSVAVVSGLIMMAAGTATARPVLTVMGAPDDVLDLAVLYLRIYFLGMPFSMVYNFGSAVLRSRGDTRRPLYCLLVSGVFNVGLNLFFVIVLDMSVAGVACATVLANLLNALLILYFLKHEEDRFRFSLRHMGFDRALLSQILKIGIPSGLQGVVFSISNVCIQSAINSFGSSAIAGSAAAVNFEFLSFFIVNAFVQTAVTFTSQNFGAGNFRRCTKVYIRCVALGIGCAALADYTFIFFREPLMGLFTADAAVIPYAYLRLSHVLMFQPLVAGYEITGGAMRGTGRSLAPALISLFGTCLLRICWAFAVVNMGLSYSVLLDTYPVSWIITNIMMTSFYFYFRKRDFRNRSSLVE